MIDADKPVLSILTAAMLRRSEVSTGLALNLRTQVLDSRGRAEALWLVDEGERTTGEKRTDLVRMARGAYFAFVDDDDEIAADYVHSIVGALQARPMLDLLTFHVRYRRDGQDQFIARFVHGIECTEEDGPGRKRYRPGHTMVWRRELVLDLPFPHRYRGEDTAWAGLACKRVTRWMEIPKVLYTYHDCAPGSVPSLGELSDERLRAAARRR